MKEGERSLDLFKLFGTVVVKADEAINSLQETKEAAKETGDSVGDLGSESKKAGKTTVDSMQPIPSKFAKVAQAGAAVVTAVVAIGTAMVEVAESTREYRTEMGKLEAAFSASGHSGEVATDTYRELYSIIGETDQAVEASQQIALLANTTEDAASWADLAAGVFGAFGDALQPETFYEAANETYSLNEATGAYVQMLEQSHMSVEAFNQGLQACTTEEEKQAYMLDVARKALGKASEAYKKNNKELIAANTAQENLNAATARWGEICEPVVSLFKEGLAEAINFAADAFEYLLDPAKAVEDTLVGTSETSAEAAEKVEFLKGKLEEFNEVPPVLWTPELTQQKEDLTVALQAAESQYNELAEAERLAGEEASSSATSSAEAVAEYSTITGQYVSDAMSLFESFGETYEAMYDKVSSFFEPFETAKVTVETSVEDMMSAMQSQIDFNNTYTENLQKLKEYGLGSMAEAFQSYGEEGSVYAATIVDAVEEAGGATTEKGQEIIQGFADINQGVADSRADLSDTMALMNGEFEAQLQEMVETYGTAVDDLDKSAEAKSAATSTFQAFLDGMNSKLPAIKSQMKSFGEQITSSLQSGISDVSINVNVSTSGSIPGAKCGMDYVPYDDYLVYLHKGEAVLTAEEAAAWRAGKDVASSGSTGDSGSGGGVTVNQYIESVPQTPVELASATAAYFEQARWIT